jgi:hypothetical protein
VAAGICFECDSVVWGKKKRRRGACERVHMKGEGGSERGPYHGGRQRKVARRGPGHRARVAPLVCEHGRAAAVGDAVTQANMADERDRGEAGPGVSGGVQERVKGRETALQRGADTRAWAAQRRAARFKLGLNRNQNSNETKLISNSFIF